MVNVKTKALKIVPERFTFRHLLSIKKYNIILLYTSCKCLDSGSLCKSLPPWAYSAAQQDLKEKTSYPLMNLHLMLMLFFLLRLRLGLPGPEEALRKSSPPQQMPALRTRPLTTWRTRLRDHVRAASMPWGRTQTGTFFNAAHIYSEYSDWNITDFDWMSSVRMILQTVPVYVLKSATPHSYTW